MSMKQLAVLSALQTYGRLNGTTMNPTPGSPQTPVRGVNVMLGGAMLSGIILVVFVLCYCCHKTNKKTMSELPSYWRDPALSMEIFTIDAQNCFITEITSTQDQVEVHQVPASPGPPPSYEIVIAASKSSNCLKENEPDGDPPNYEMALKLGKDKYEDSESFV